MGLYLHIRIDIPDAVHRRENLGSPQVVGVVKDLPLEVAEIHMIEIDDPEPADPRRRQVEGGRTPEATGPDQEGATVEELPLPFPANLRKNDVAAVPLDLLLAKRDRPSSNGRNQGHLISIHQCRVLALQVLHGDVVHIDVDMSMNLSFFIKDPLPNPRILGVESPDEIHDGLSFDLYRGLITGKGSKRRRNVDLGPHQRTPFLCTT